MQDKSSPTGDIFPQGARGEAAALRLPEELARDAWQAMLPRLASLERATPWWLGDALAFGERRRWGTYAEIARQTRRSAQGLRNRASVSRRVPAERRRPELSWRAHRVVADADLSPDEQVAWLSRAVDERWTSDELAKKIGVAATASGDSGDGATESGRGGGGSGAPPAEGKPSGKGDGNDKDEWYTPEDLVEAARDAMGEIDLDPASCDVADAVVRASRYYTREQNGLDLDREWAGRVFMNPPYSSLARWVDRLVRHHAASEVEQAVVLIRAGVGDSWFYELAEASDALCLLRERVRFWHPGKDSIKPTEGQVVAYLGADVDRFADRFARFGKVVRPC